MPAAGRDTQGSLWGCTARCRWEVRHGVRAPAPGRWIRTAGDGWAGVVGPVVGGARGSRMGRTAPRAALRKMLKNEKPGFRLSACADLLVRKERGGRRVRGLGLVRAV